MSNAALDGLPLFYPRHPGAKEKGSTSEAAAMAIEREAHTIRASVLVALGRFGALSADEVAAKIGKSILAVRPRLSELRKLGLIEPSGERVENASGMSAKRWRIVA